MKINSTYGSAHVLVKILDAHDRRPKPHLVLLETIRSEYADIPHVASVQNPYDMLRALEKLAPALLRGEERPGVKAQLHENYAICADAHMRLKAKLAQYEAAA